MEKMTHGVKVSTLLAYLDSLDCTLEIVPRNKKSRMKMPEVEQMDSLNKMTAKQFIRLVIYAQGLVAGVNAALKILGKEPLMLDRASSYIGTLIDDLVTKGCNDPYRMMTSRSEYRLILRQDNADTRLTPTGRRIGLINDERWEKFNRKQERIAAEQKRVKTTTLSPTDELNAVLRANNTSELTTGIRLIELLKRPELSYATLEGVDKTRTETDNNVLEQVEIQIKYDGYIKRQLIIIEQVRRLETKHLPDDIDYSSIDGLSLEAREKLGKVRPDNIGQASRISGVSPADISVLVIYLSALKNKAREENE